MKEEPTCSEARAAEIARELALEIRPGDRVVLEGPLGAGKSTFAKFVLPALGVAARPEGSPTFAIAHEYAARGTRVVHVDLYRIRSEGEIEDAGIPEYFQDERSVVLIEWLSLWESFQKAVLSSAKRVFIVRLAFTDRADARNVRIERLELTAK